MTIIILTLRWGYFSSLFNIHYRILFFVYTVMSRFLAGSKWKKFWSRWINIENWKVFSVHLLVCAHTAVPTEDLHYHGWNGVDISQLQYEKNLYCAWVSKPIVLMINLFITGDCILYMCAMKREFRFCFVFLIIKGGVCIFRFYSHLYFFFSSFSFFQFDILIYSST